MISGMENLTSLMFAVFVILQLADGYLSARALKLPGLKEANPIMAWLNSKIGTVPALAVTKTASVLVMLHFLPATPWQVYLFLNGVYGYVVWRNLKLLRSKM